MRWAKVLLTGVLCGLPAIIGCGGGTASVGAVPATGTVTLDGKPLDGATIAFVPDGEGGASASGLTDASGNFRMTTLQPGDGAVPGKYKVTVSKLVEGEEAVDETPKSQEEAMQKLKERAAQGGSNAFYHSAPLQPVKESLPKRYSNAETSGLQADVTSDGDNNFTFALTTSG